MGAGPPRVFLEESVVNEHLEDIYGYRRSTTWSGTPRTHKVNNRIAAYMLAIDRVAYTIKQRGITPRWTP